jgi:hypothetical protein
MRAATHDRARAAALLAPLGLHPGQEVLLLELARTGPKIQAQLSVTLGCEPPSVTLMVHTPDTRTVNNVGAMMCVAGCGSPRHSRLVCAASALCRGSSPQRE